MDTCNSPHFPQHIEKCYCQRTCFCESVEKPQKTSNKFIKIRNETGHLKPKCERIPFSGPSSRCTSKNSERYSSLFHHPTEFEKLSSTSSDLTLTDRRYFYERSKEVSPVLSQASLPHSYHHIAEPQMTFVNYVDEDRIKALNEFRVKNARDCFSVLSRHSISQRLGKYTNKPDEKHECEFVYKINSRGLLSPVNTTEDGKLVCGICNKTEESPFPNGIVPMSGAGSRLHKIVLQMPEDYTSKSGKGFARKKNEILPSNSLALRYQKLV